MWRTVKATEENGRAIKLAFIGAKGALRFSDVLDLWAGSEDFRSYFIAELAAAPFSAYRWETPGVTASTISADFECVALDSPGLARSPDVHAFSKYFQRMPKTTWPCFRISGRTPC